MVEIREESSSSASSSNGNVTCIAFFKSQPTYTALFLTRLITIFCSLYYVLPIGTPIAQQIAYSRAFFAAAATNALRLHQRVGGLQFSREFFSRVAAEDACHYLLYSLLFVNTAPVTMALWPVFLFAVLHNSKFLSQLCIATGNGNTRIAQKLEEFNASQTFSLLCVIACSEIFMAVLLIAMVFTGRCFIFFPFLYYRFLVFRYTSRRNASTRIVFYQLRIMLENAVENRYCPQIVRNGAAAFIRFLCSLSPNEV